MTAETATAGDEAGSARGPAASLSAISKRFGATRALIDIDLEVRAGTVHALVGENGAGKSTALGILAGRVAPTEGEVRLFGQTLSHANPRDARRVGLGVIYQELTIAPDLDAAANVFIGHPLASGGFLAERRMRRRYVELCERFGVTAHLPGVAAGTLSVAEQQVLEILRALAFDARLILFDEPTASLGAAERRALLALIGQLREEGKTMVFVSHNLDEVLEIADTVSVFRNGSHVATAERAAWDKRKVVTAMIGDTRDLHMSDSLDAGLMDADPGPPEAGAHPDRRAPRRRAGARRVLEVEGLTVPGAVAGVDLSVAAGEIVGLGGLVGSGRTSVLRALAGLSRRATGAMRVDGREVRWPRTVRSARRHGIALLPEDRKGAGLAMQLDGAMNVLMPDMGAATSLGLISEGRARGLAARAAAPFGFDPERLAEPAGRLSGGNQQKLLLARWGHCRPRILLVDEPTRGIDIAAKDEVLTALGRMASEGMAIVFVSSELEEVALMCERVLVLSEGRPMGSLESGREGIRVADILGRVFTVEEAV